ncbi:hypothetical protein OG599_35150 (plasmid) [Streptomyces sp. NBC_01335]|uniref:hypothetical protein n=1 Tax=Streptomyces sp. NBC_01335 TaxID=2903828 RepID=UPI002E10C6F2|nr:hypothetical protein OG599_35150 [Streptomyces sp. NBC_01335]
MITPPAYTPGYDRCTASVTSLDGGIAVNYTLSPQQVDAWTDDDLLNRVQNLKDAVAALLPVGTDIQASISWGRSQSLTVMQESGVVKADI